MMLANWFFDQKLSDWVQGLGSLAAAAAAVGIALRQETTEHRRAESARKLRRQVLAAAIEPVLRDLDTTARLRNGLVQALGRTRRGEEQEEAPHMEQLLIPLPDIFMSTIERMDVFGARIASEVYTLMHRVNDYNRDVHAMRDLEVPVRTWTANLRPKLDAVIETLALLMPHMHQEVSGLDAAE